MAAVANMLCLAGVGGMAYGLWLLSPAVAFIFVGLVTTSSGVWLYNRRSVSGRAK